MAKVELDLVQIAKEVREHVARLKGDGATQEEVRDYMVRSIDHTTLKAFEQVGEIIVKSPEAGLSFTYSVYESLGGINAVMAEEGISPIHISEPDFIREVMVKTIEDFTGQDIDTVFNKFDKYQQDQRGGLQ